MSGDFCPSTVYWGAFWWDMAILLYAYPAVLLSPYFVLHLPCCALIFLRTYPAVRLFFLRLPCVKGRYRRTNILPTYAQDKLGRETEGELELFIYTTKVVVVQPFGSASLSRSVQLFSFSQLDF